MNREEKIADLKNKLEYANYELDWATQDVMSWERSLLNARFTLDQYKIEVDRIRAQIKELETDEYA